MNTKQKINISTEEIKNLLEEFGYPLKEDGDFWRSPAIHRDGDNPTSLSISRKNGKWTDFVENKTGDLLDIIAMNLSIDRKASLKWLKEKDLVNSGVEDKEVKTFRAVKFNGYFDKSILNHLKDNHDYWINRQIPKEVIEQFKGGVCYNFAKLKHRYCFPIFDLQDHIVGLVGRTLVKHPIKVKNLGVKNDWLYPVFLNKEIIQEKKSVILVEGIPDMLSLWTCGIKNVICLFGISCNLKILNFLIANNLDKIIISTNSDEAGAENAEKLNNKFCRYFNHHQIITLLPEKKDLNEILCKDGKEAIINMYAKYI